MACLGGLRKSPRSFNVLLACISLVFPLLTVELGMRAWHWLHPVSEQNPAGSRESWVAPDTELGYRVRPGIGRLTNSHGLVGPELEPAGSRFRILILGDSVIFRRDNLVHRMRGLLTADTDTAPVELLNAGVPGYTNYQQVAYLKRYGVAFKPDVVGIVFVLNDLHRFLHAPRFVDGKVVGSSFWNRAGPADAHPLVRGLTENSQLAAWLSARLAALWRLGQVRVPHAYTFENNRDFRTAWDDRAWGDIERQIGEAAALGRSFGFRLFVAIMPFGEQFRPDYLQRDRDYVTKPQRRMREICDRIGLPYLDLMPLLNPGRDLNSDLIHLTAEGKSVVARAMVDFLKEERLIPARGGGQ